MALFCLLAFAAFTPVLAQDVHKEGASSEDRSSKNLRSYVPDTVSEGWRGVYESFPDPTKVPAAPGPDDIAGWKVLHDAMEEKGLKLSEQAVKLFEVSFVNKNWHPGTSLRTKFSQLCRIDYRSGGVIGITDVN